jgi:hypothetical protein
MALLMAATKIHFKEQALVASTKPTIQADKAVRLGCFFSAPYLCFLSEVDFLSTNIL